MQDKEMVNSELTLVGRPDICSEHVSDILSSENHGNTTIKQLHFQQHFELHVGRCGPPRITQWKILWTNTVPPPRRDIFLELNQYHSNIRTVSDQKSEVCSCRTDTDLVHSLVSDPTPKVSLNYCIQIRNQLDSSSDSLCKISLCRKYRKSFANCNHDDHLNFDTQDTLAVSSSPGGLTK